MSNGVPATVRVLTTQAELAALRTDWTTLLTRTSTANVFLTFEWLSTWCHYYGAGAQLCILAAYERDELIGLAPLVIQDRRLAGVRLFRRVAFLGNGLSDRLDMLLAPGAERVVLEAFVSHLRLQRWDVLDLQDVPEDSPTAKLLPQIAECPGARVEVSQQSICPVVTFRGDTAGQFASFGRHLRQNIGYYGRRLRRRHEVAIDVVHGGPQLTEHLDGFTRVYRKAFADRPDTHEVISDRFAAFRRDAAVRLAEHGHLMLTLLRLDRVVVAGELCFPFRATCYRYNCCYDPAWKDEHLGTVLLWETMRAAIDIGCREYDFLRGDEPYKFQWGAQPRRHVRIRVSRVSPKLRLLEAGARWLRRRHAHAEGRSMKHLSRTEDAACLTDG